MTRISVKLTVALLLLIAGSVIYVSCNKAAVATTRTLCTSCLNGGQCINDSCHCPSGYTGSECQTSFAEALAGNWTVYEQGSLNTNVQEFSTEIYLLSSPANSLEIYELNEYDYVSYVTMTVQGDSLVIQPISNNGYTIQGSAHIVSGTGNSGTVLSVRYEAVNNTTGAIDDYGYNAGDGSSPAILTKE